MRYILSLFLVFSCFLDAQNNYPQDYFSKPLDIPLILSGTFAELRSNHFHSGLDIKTQHRTGLTDILQFTRISKNFRQLLKRM